MRKSNKEKMSNYCEDCNCGSSKSSACGGAVYGLGFLGATVYYVSTASSFGAGVVGFLKALVWPAFLVYDLFKFLGM